MKNILQGFKKHQKILTVTGLSLLTGMLAFAGVKGILAYRTDSEQMENTFTVGDVSINLTETAWPGNEDDSVKNQLSSQEILKNPVITNNGTNDAVVFIKMTVPVANVIAVDDSGNKSDAAKQELFYFKKTDDAASVHENNFYTNWIELTDKEEGTDLSGTTRTYVFGYATKLAKDEFTSPLFDKVQLKKTLEGNLPSGTTENIVVEAYAIQANDIISLVPVDTSSTMNAETLSKIYAIFLNQNS